MTVEQLRWYCQSICDRGQGDDPVLVQAIGLPDAPPEAKFPVHSAISDGDFTLLFTFAKIYKWPPLNVEIASRTTDRRHENELEKRQNDD